MPQPDTAEMTRLPLAGRRVLVTRAEDQAADFVARLRALGACPLVCPTIRIVPPADYASLDAAICRFASYDWIVFTSANGVRALVERATRNRVSLANMPRIAAIGPATANALREHGLAVAFMPTRHIAEGLVDEIADVSGMSILVPTADIARPTLADGLRARGATVEVVTAYRTVAADPAHVAAWFAQAPAFDAVTFTSSSTAEQFVTSLGQERARSALRDAVIACIGPKTAASARDHGLRVDVEATEHTTDGLLQALAGYYESKDQR